MWRVNMRCIMWVILLILAVINCPVTSLSAVMNYATTVQLEHGDLAKDDLETGRWKESVDQNEDQCAPPEFAGRGFELFPGVGYYKMHLLTVTWEAATMICVNEGAHLAIINSEAEAEVLSSLRQRFTNATEYTYLGFHDQVNNREFITVLGDLLDESGYQKWKPGEPNNLNGNEHCGSMTRDALLNDHGCDNGLNFICEHELF